MTSCKLEFIDKFSLLDYGLRRAPEGNAVEFGVGDGTTLQFIAQRRPGATYGFDSFEGLPEYWRDGFEKGTFAGAPPNVLGAELVVGWFDDTVPDQLPDNITFVHIDCDLYSSTTQVLENLGQLQTGTVIQFDELYGYPGWPNHEFQALLNWISSDGPRLDVLGYVPDSEQVSFIVR